ncbi:TetR/AcrR family transcriptional regulator [Neorhizobium alkalisoli]|uniref:TetR family transcriptional regulator n=1 Tax=Neorhizobium alkalisoli TaxID=528178 RepID=A0A561QG90_9HYPH|nr:TetR/AcrR family transcriptional regulator [Neorhizobium alkalisoli]TWF49388.1 TetR family transcriptional regulator [Neorhizobium alkalisoli]
MDTREQIMTVARAMVQSHGYNALSFREIAKAIGVKSASIHYHFPTKGDLGAALADRYAQEAEQAFARLSLSPQDREATMAAYLAPFRAALLNENRMCLYGIMVAEHDDLPDEVRRQVNRFTEVNTDWLERVTASFYPKVPEAERRARALAMFSAIEGAQLIARGRADITVFDATISAYRNAGLLP